MCPKKYDMTYSKKGTPISYAHYAVLVFAQGVWAERDKEAIHKKSKANITKTPNLFRSDSPASCDICIQIHDIFGEIKGKNDGILYTTHSLLLEIDEIKVIANMFLADDLKVKKLYIFQGGPVKRSERGKKIDIRKRLTSKKVFKDEFLEILENGNLKKK